MTRARVRSLLPLLLTLAAALPVSAQAVVGGHPASASEYPWLASNGGCAGALIAPDRLLTAAHCEQGHAARYERWTLGTTRTGRALTVADVALHPRWDLHARDRGEQAGHDLAILRVSPPVTGVPVLPHSQAPENARPDRAGRRGAHARLGHDDRRGDAARAGVRAARDRGARGRPGHRRAHDLRRVVARRAADPAPLAPATVCARDDAP